jgi:hypothetical protein
VKADTHTVLLDAIRLTPISNSYVTFGTYPQTTDGGDRTPIEWMVLAEEGDRKLLISRYALDCKIFNSFTRITWPDCSLREWLNETFLYDAFSSSERQMIVKSVIDGSVDGVEDTTDSVFLLSYDECLKYFSDNIERMCAPTDYAIKQGVYSAPSSEIEHQIDGRGACRWWIRTTYTPLPVYGLRVFFDGSVSNGGGIYVDEGGIGVRPAIWVKFN